MFGGGKLSRDKRAMVAQFTAITSTSCAQLLLRVSSAGSSMGVRVRAGRERTALEALKYCGWELEAALEAYFNHCAPPPSPPPPVLCSAPLQRRRSRRLVRGWAAGAFGGGPKVDTAKIEEFFEAYKEEGGDAVGVDGVIKLCEDLGVGEEDVVMLVIAWELKAQKMAAFSKDEWMSGFTRLGIEGLDKLKAELGGLRSKLEDDVAFKEVYGFAFGYYKEETQKSIAQETVRRNGRFAGFWVAFFQECQQ